jgi:hypothetical protein
MTKSDPMFFLNAVYPVVMSFVPLFCVLPFLIANFVLAGRLQKSRGLWLFISILPIVNIFGNVYLCYAMAIRIFDRLESISSRLPQIETA